MKIAFVNDTFLQGRGSDTVIYELARRLGRKHDVFVITSETDMPEENFKIIKTGSRKLLTGNNLIDSLMYFPNLIKTRREISKTHRKYHFDVFNVHHSALNIATMGLPTVVTWHGSPISNNMIRKNFNKLVLKSLRKNRISVTVSEYLKKTLSRIVKLKKIKTIYNGVSKEFKPIKKDKGFMFFVGRLEEHKSVHELIRLSKETNFPLKIVGSGPLESRLKKYVKKINANEVIFLGKISREDLIKNYQECSFFISASKWEGFGLIFMEAAACGKPSIGYNTSAIPEIIKDGETGFIVNNYNEFKEKARELIKNKILRKKMGRRALKFSKGFSWDKTSKKYEEIFELSRFNKNKIS